jgi:O-antigen/teichoic acid export membrane protein
MEVKKVNSGQLASGTAEERAHQRHRRAAWASVTSVGSKLASVITILVTAPLTIRYLGMERYGMWMTIAAAVAMLSSSDLGIGNGLMTLIAETHGLNDRDSARRYVGSAMAMLSAVAASILLITLLVYPYLRWSSLIRVTSPEALRDLGPTFLVLIVCFAINMPLGISNRVLTGYQEGYLANLWAILGSVLALAAVLVAVHLHMGLPWLVMGFTGGPVLAMAMNFLWLFGNNRPWLRPTLSDVHADSTRRLFSMGILFFILQTSLAVGFQSDSIVIAHLLGAEKVAQYSLTARLFSLCGVVLNFIIVPLWPAYGEAAAKGDRAWLMRTFRRSLLFSISFSVVTNLLLVFTGRLILRLWIGPQVVPTLALLIGLAICQSLQAITNTFSILLNGLKIMRFQAICFSTMAVVNILCSIALTRRIGISGVVYGSIIAQVLCFMLPAAVLAPRFLRNYGSATMPPTTLNQVNV